MDQQSFLQQTHKNTLIYDWSNMSSKDRTSWHEEKNTNNHKSRPSTQAYVILSEVLFSMFHAPDGCESMKLSVLLNKY